jgi:hypothetical protein
MNWEEFTPNLELLQYNRNTTEMNTIIKNEIQIMVQEYADDNELFNLKSNHIFELPSIIRYYNTANPDEENYRRSYLIMNFYTYDYIRKQVYKGKKYGANDLILKIKPFVENKIKSTRFMRLTF